MKAVQNTNINYAVTIKIGNSDGLVTRLWGI